MLLLLLFVFQLKCLGQPWWPPSRNEIPSLQILTEEVSLHCGFSNKRFGIPQHKYLDFTWSQSQRRAEVHPTERQIRTHRHICRWKRLVQLLSPFRVISWAGCRANLCPSWPAVPGNWKCVCLSCSPPPPRFPTRRQIRAYGLTDEQLQRHTQVNKILGERSLKSKWGYRGISQHVYCESHVSEWDHYHLNSIALSGIKTVLKNRVLYRKRYSKKLAKKQHLAFYECQSYEKCKCGSFRE